LIQDLKGAFGVRRLVAALKIVIWRGNGSLLPFSGETNAWLQAYRGNPGSKLPVRGCTRLLKIEVGLIHVIFVAYSIRSPLLSELQNPDNKV